MPGVSRGGAVLIAARLRGLGRPASLRLSTRTGVPIALGAAGLKTLRAMRGGSRAPGAADGGRRAGRFCNHLAAAPFAARLERARSLAPLGIYRIVVGLF